MKREFIRLLISSFGIIILGLSLSLLSWKFQLVSSGLPGYALAVNFLSGFSVGVFLLFLNSMILLLSFLLAGKTQGIRGVYGYVLLSFVVDVSKKYIAVSQIPLSSLPINTLLIVSQGMIAPIAIAVVMANGYSFGSYSSMMPIVKRFNNISAPNFFMLMDAILVLCTVLLFGWNKALLLSLNAVTFFLVFRIAIPFAERHLTVR